MVFSVVQSKLKMTLQFFIFLLHEENVNFRTLGWASVELLPQSYPSFLLILADEQIYQGFTKPREKVTPISKFFRNKTNYFKPDRDLCYHSGS